MTEIGAGEVQIVAKLRLALAALLELRHWVSTFLSSRACSAPIGECDAATPDDSESAVRRRRIDTAAATTAGRADQTQLLQQMVQWMQAVAVAIKKERGDEQDHR